MSHNNKKMPLPPTTTDTPIGSAERIAVMEARVAAGYAPIHPDDKNDLSGAVVDVIGMARHDSMKHRYCSEPLCQSTYAMRVPAAHGGKYLCGYCIHARGIVIDWHSRGAA